MSDDGEVVDAELVPDSEVLPADAVVLAPQPGSRPAVDRHTILRPGQALPTEADQPTYTEADLYVSEETARLLDEESEAANTVSTYKSQRKKFREWCAANGKVAYPCTTAVFVDYVGHLIEAEVAPNTVSVAMSAVRTWMPEDKQPGTREARGMLRKYRKRWNKMVGVKKAPAITDAMMRDMLATCDLRHPVGLRDACMLVLGRGALNRRIELADLSIADVTMEDAGVELLIRTSKTDQEGRGEKTFIPAEDDPLLDPVRRTKEWLAMLYALGVREGAFLRALTVAGTLQSRATASVRGDYVTGAAVNGWVRGRACRAGIEGWEKVTAHGLRRGGAQAIADAGGDPTKQGRWKAGSAVVKREYLDRAQSRAENPWLIVQEAKRRAAEGN
ncbi:integrase [Actinacidiphila acididurans]|uniref:Integrase n=1 Tax=Actinacidiphila acididurans TaxID=2784346 RepID=A0ABS2TXA5_9ACTN|nr:integrase [Actinacidiphila acididurans]MBM9507977.1 integrase [Actinacidiphila acididurans]